MQTNLKPETDVPLRVPKALLSDVFWLLFLLIPCLCGVLLFLPAHCVLVNVFVLP